MSAGGTELDITTLLVGVAVIVFSVSLAQLTLLGIFAWLRRRSQKTEHDLDGDGIHNEDDLL